MQFLRGKVGWIRTKLAEMGLGALLLSGLTHPSELKAMITYKIWRDPLRKIEDSPESSGWYAHRHGAPRMAPDQLSRAGIVRI